MDSYRADSRCGGGGVGVQDVRRGVRFNVRNVRNAGRWNVPDVNGPRAKEDFILGPSTKSYRSLELLVNLGILNHVFTFSRRVLISRPRRLEHPSPPPMLHPDPGPRTPVRPYCFPLAADFFTSFVLLKYFL